MLLFLARYWVKVETYAAVMFLCQKRCALGKCITCVTFFNDSLFIMIASVWPTLRGTLASVHDMYATFFNDEPVVPDSTCLIMRGQYGRRGSSRVERRREVSREEDTIVEHGRVPCPPAFPCKTQISYRSHKDLVRIS